MSLARSVSLFARSSRPLTTSSVVKNTAGDVHPGYKKLKVKQDRFNIEDGTPIFIKGGALDNILYRVTMACCIGAVIWDVSLYYELSLK